MRSDLHSSITSRFHVVESLSNTYGPLAFLAEDRLFPGRRCVLTLAPSGVQESGAEWHDRIRAILGLRHPGLTPIVAASGEDVSAPAFFAVEAPEGDTFASRFRDIRSRLGNDAAFVYFRRGAAVICKTLEYLHSRGVLHYDLRPGRFLHGPEGAPVIVGYGFGPPLFDDLAQPSSDLAYIAPEILRGDPVDHRADLYSLGVILYEILTGRNPYLQANVTDTTRAHLELLPPPPRAADATIPADLNEIVLLLLTKQPARTFANAGDVADALDPSMKGRRRRTALSPSAFTQNEFVGRKRELRVLQAFLDRVVAGHSRERAGASAKPAVDAPGAATVSILAPAGFGKSRLLAEFRQRARLAGAAYLDARGSDPSGGSLGTVRALADRFCELFPAEGAGIPREFADAPPLEFGAALAQAAIAASAKVPIVLAIDDVHRLESASAAALGSLIQTLSRRSAAERPHRVLLVLAMRDAVAETGQVVNYRQEKPEGDADRVLRLGEFSRQEIESFVRAFFTNEDAVQPIAAELKRVAGGNPYLMEETVREWLARGRVRWKDGRWLLDFSRSRTEILDLNLVAGERVRGLSGSSERLLQLTVLLRRPLTHAWISQFEEDATAAGGALLELLNRGLIRRFLVGGEERFEVAHALLAEAMEREIPVEARRQLHRRIAQILERDLERNPENATETAFHYLRADMPELAASLLLSASETSRLNTPRERIRLYEDLSSQLGVKSTLRGRILYELGVRRTVLCDFRGALQVLNESLVVAEQFGTAEEQARVLRQAARVHQAMGRTSMAANLLDESMRRATPGTREHRNASIEREIVLKDQIGGADAAARLERLFEECSQAAAGGSPSNAEYLVRLRLVLAEVHERNGQWRLCEQALQQARECQEKSGSSLTRMELSLAESRFHAARGRFPEALELNSHAAAMAKAVGHRLLEATALLSRGVILGSRGHTRHGAALVRAGIVELRLMSARMADALVMRAQLALQQGESARMMRLLETSERESTTAPSPWLDLERAHIRFLDAWRLGDFRRSAIMARKTLTLARSLGATPALLQARVNLAEHLRGRGRMAGARRVYLGVLRRARLQRTADTLTLFRACLGYCRLNLGLGRVELARRFLSMARAAMPQLRQYPELADLRAAEGEFALILGDTLLAERAFRAALRIDDRLRRPVERADDLQGLARAALQRGDLDAAWARATLAEDYLAPATRFVHAPSTLTGGEVRRWIDEVKTTVERGRLLRRRQLRVEFIRAIGKFQNTLSETASEWSLADRIALFAVQTLNGESAFVFMDRPGGAITLGAMTAAGERARTEPLFANRFMSGEPKLNESSVFFGKERVWTDLKREGRTWGRIMVEAQSLARRFDAGDMEILRSIATLAALCIRTPAPESTPGEFHALEHYEHPDDARLWCAGGASSRKVYRQIERFATSPLPVLITGEIGSGKEMVAKLLHEMRTRSGPCVTVECATLRPELAESLLLGHERGAFTGASSRQPGLLEQADGGTLILDHVDTLCESAQILVLRYLEKGEIRRLGSSQMSSVHARVIAITSADLESLVAAGQFRADLYYALRGLRIAVPPLRERREDILPLVEQFSHEQSAGRPLPRLSPAATRAILRAHWPGNCRQLRSEVARWVEEEVGEVRVAHLKAGRILENRVNDVRFGDQREAFERKTIQDALERSQGRPSRAARLLQMPRSTFYLKARLFGLLENKQKRSG